MSSPRRRTRERPFPWYPVGVVGTLCILVVALAATDATYGRYQEFCTVCGARTASVGFLGRVYRSPRDSDAAYHGWFETHISLAHEHDWMPTGSFSHGLVFRSIACGRPCYELNGLFQLLVALEDQEAAVRAARLLASLPAEVRRREIVAAVMDLGGLAWGFGERSGREGRDPDDVYRAWLAAHPIWAGVLPEHLRVMEPFMIPPRR